MENILYKDENSKFCSDCGKVIKLRAEICPNCGCRQAFSLNINGKNKIAAALFAFFLGSFGAHKFYLGKIWFGVLYLIFSWTFIPGVISIIEGLLFLIMSDQDFNMKYNS